MEEMTTSSYIGTQSVGKCRTRTVGTGRRHKIQELWKDQVIILKHLHQFACYKDQSHCWRICQLLLSTTSWWLFTWGFFVSFTFCFVSRFSTRPDPWRPSIFFSAYGLSHRYTDMTSDEWVKERINNVTFSNILFTQMSELHCCLRKGVPFEDPVLGHLASPTGNRILTFRSNIVSSFGRVRTFGPLNLLPRNAEILYYVAPYHKTSDSPITQLRKPQTSQMPLQPQNLEI